MSDEEMIEKIDYTKNPVVLSASHVSKCFKLPTEQATGLKQAFINWTKGIKGYKKQEVLKDISFEVHQGEFFGIVGRNGGGLRQVHVAETDFADLLPGERFDHRYGQIGAVHRTWRGLQSGAHRT